MCVNLYIFLIKGSLAVIKKRLPNIPSDRN